MCRLQTRRFSKECNLLRKNEQVGLIIMFCYGVCVLRMRMLSWGGLSESGCFVCVCVCVSCEVFVYSVLKCVYSLAINDVLGEPEADAETVHGYWRENLDLWIFLCLHMNLIHLT